MNATALIEAMSAYHKVADRPYPSEGVRQRGAYGER